MATDNCFFAAFLTEVVKSSKSFETTCCKSVHVPMARTMASELSGTSLRQHFQVSRGGRKWKTTRPRVSKAVITSNDNEIAGETLGVLTVQIAGPLRGGRLASVI